MHCRQILCDAKIIGVKKSLIEFNRKPMWEDSPFGERSIFHPSHYNTKALSIKYIGSKKINEYTYVYFSVITKNLINTKAIIVLKELEIILDEVAASKAIDIPRSGSLKVELKFKEENLSKTILEGEFEFKASITCDGLSAETEEFRLKLENVKEPKKDVEITEKVKPTCFCKEQGLVNISCEQNGLSISDDLYGILADELGVEKAIFFAIAKQESKIAPFVQHNPQKATILLERHYVYRLIKNKYGVSQADFYKKTNPLLCHENVSAKGSYGSSVSQLDRLEVVKKWDSTIAIQSCSWGKFQIMGEYFLMSKHYKNAGEFETAMNQCELQHFQYFKHFIKNVKGIALITAMKNKDWEEIAKQFNGKYWKKFNPNYANNIKTYYEEFKL
jgi:hypothetical protein